MPIFKANTSRQEHELQQSFSSKSCALGLHLTNSLTVVGADRDRISFLAAQQMSTRYRSGNLIPLRSRFSQLPQKLSQLGLDDFFDVIILETGISTLQWNDTARGFCPRRKGNKAWSTVYATEFLGPLFLLFDNSFFLP